MSNFVNLVGCFIVRRIIYEAFLIGGGIGSILYSIFYEENEIVFRVGIALFVIGLFVPSGKKQSQSMSSSTSRTVHRSSNGMSRDQIIQRMNYLLSEIQALENHAMEVKTRSSINTSLNGIDVFSAIGMFSADNAVKKDKERYDELKKEYDRLNRLL